MRVIKFRAWTNANTDENRMVYDYQNTTYAESFGYEDKESDLFNLRIMQFTGAEDKEGNEIYQGDIFEYAGRRFVIDWHQYGCKWAGRIGDIWYNFTPREGRVIGNIYENNNLLTP